MSRIIVRRAGQIVSEHDLSAEPLTVGRDASCGLVLADSTVSRRHARIGQTPAGGYRVVDLGSGNGVFHQGKKVAELDLYPGCEFEIGALSLTLEGGGKLPLLVLVAGGALRSFPLSSDETIVGRSPDVPISLPEPLVSSRHLKILRRGDVHTVVDLGSENGTYVNGVRVKSKELAQGDQIQLGGLTLFFARDGIVPDPQAIKILQPTHSAAPAPAAAPVAPPPVPAPAARAPVPARAGSPSPSRSRLLLAGIAGFFLLFLLVIVMLLRSPDEAAEQEFQEVFQSDLNAEAKARIDEYLARAREYEDGGNMDLALEQYRKILVLDATHQDSIAAAARLEETIEKEKAARGERERAEREKNAQVAALADKAAALVAEAKFDEARSVLEEARALAPGSEVLQTKLVETYVAQGNSLKTRDAARAREAYEKALELDPANASARQGLSGMDQSRRASRDRQKRIEELTDQGLAQLKREEFRQAYASFSEVLKLDPSNARAREFRAQAGQLLEGQVEPMYQEGVRRYNAGDLSGAMAQFQKVLAMHPDHAETRSFMATASERVRTEAVDRYKRAYIYEGLGRLREALELYRETLALLPDPKEEYHQKASQRIAELSRKVQ
jgi:pSer/pThr/pTyr-binding forkhead associated (FHA) protein/tetratricopeptide (TPR) repeat protein